MKTTGSGSKAASPSKVDGLVLWAPARVAGACRLTEFDGFDRDHLLTHGESLLAAWPAGVSYGMDPFAPSDMLVLDAVRARQPVIVASARFARFLIEALLEQIELLPITLVNHKKRALPEPFFIVNLLGTVDCLDLKRCRPVWSEIARESIDSVERLVVDASKVDATRSLFRPRYYQELILVRRSLLEAIADAGFTGVASTELDDFENF